MGIIASGSSTVPGEGMEPTTFADADALKASFSAPVVVATPDPASMDTPAPVVAPAASETAPVAVEPEPADDDAEPEAELAADPAAPPRESRNQRYNRSVREAQQRAEAAEQRVQWLEQQMRPPAPAPPLPGPPALLTEEQFGAEYERQMGQAPDYREYDRYVAREEGAAAARREMQTAQDAQRQQQEAAWQADLTARYDAGLPAARQKYPDWDAMLATLPALPPDVERAVMLSAAPQDFAYYLAATGEAARIARLPVVQRGFEIGKLVGKEPWAVAAGVPPAPGSPPVRTETRAPRVVPPVAPGDQGTIPPFSWDGVTNEVKGSAMAAAKADYARRMAARGG